jgi:hypothetical protein
MSKATAKKSAAKRSRSKSPATSSKRWSGDVTRHSNALDLEEGVFKKRSARQVALSLKWSAEASKRRKGTPFQSAMSMLNFEINRAGKVMSAERRHILENAKDELRRAFDRV